MKFIRKGFLPLILAVVLFMSACSGDLIDPFGANGDDVFNPLNTNTIIEPSFVDYMVTRLLYETLNEKEKQAYRRIYNSIFEHPSKIVIPSLSEEELSTVFLALKFDNPHLLCLKNTYTYYYTDSTFYFLPEYNEKPETCEKMTAELMACAKEICSGMPGRNDEYEKELYLHDALTRLVRYGDGDNSDTAYGALVDKKAACGGYALACKLLFDMAGIQSVAVSGTTRDDDGNAVPHMWLAVDINKNWYFIDPAWDDPVGGVDGESRHTYFNVNARELELTHFGYTLPESVKCESSEEDYYTKSGLHLNRENWESTVSEQLSGAKTLPSCFEFRFEDAELFKEASERLFSNGLLADIVKANTSLSGELALSHSEDDDRSIIHIYIREKTKE